jgi:hypothetical protein
MYRCSTREKYIGYSLVRTPSTTFDAGTVKAVIVSYVFNCIPCCDWNLNCTFQLLLQNTDLHSLHGTALFFPACAVVFAVVAALSDGSGTPTDIQDSEVPGVGRRISIPSGLLKLKSKAEPPDSPSFESPESSSFLSPPTSLNHSGGGPIAASTASICPFSSALVGCLSVGLAFKLAVIFWQYWG